jgi:hypothetical protein
MRAEGASVKADADALECRGKSNKAHMRHDAARSRGAGLELERTVAADDERVAVVKNGADGDVRVFPGELDQVVLDKLAHAPAAATVDAVFENELVQLEHSSASHGGRLARGWRRPQLPTAGCLRLQLILPGTTTQHKIEISDRFVRRSQ